MRRSLLAAASITALAAAPGWAQDATEIDDEVTEPVETATAGENDTASNIVITSSGRVTLDGAAGQTGPAVLINSNNLVETGSGARISVTDVDANGDDVVIDGATGVQINGGVEGDLTHAGGVFLNDSYTATDSGCMFGWACVTMNGIRKLFQAPRKASRPSTRAASMKVSSCTSTA